MYISSFRVTNYKSFFDSGEVALGKAFNIIVGKNDSGKTSIVEALSTLSTSIPHRSPKTIPTPDTPTAPDSCVELAVAFEHGEALGTLSKVPHFYISCPQGDAGAFTSRILQILAGAFVLRVRLVNREVRGAWIEDIGEFQPSHSFGVENRRYPGGTDFVLLGAAQGNELLRSLFADFKSRVYAFRSERINLAQFKPTGATDLLPDASNLAAVLNRLIAGNRPQFELLLRHVRTIFPHITEITVPVVQNGDLARILVWSTPLEAAREDLAVPLNESGTGIGQVLAMLYVLVTARTPRAILIDEPQSFLHPGAFRKLLEILRGQGQHQYFIATHSPMGLGIGGDERVLLTRRVEFESKVELVDPNSQRDVERFLDEVGARLGDVFGADAVLWVEGRTEEVCFPVLLRRLAGVKLEGLQVLGVVSTDEFTAKAGARAFEIYTRVTRGPSLLPIAVAFVFDREGRTAQDLDDLERRSRGLVCWLPRRMFENYLLDAKAIGKVLSGLLPGSHIDSAAVEEWLGKHANNVRYVEQSKCVYPAEDWHEVVHGARLLADMFFDLSGGRVEYEKVHHGRLLVDALADDKSPVLVGLANWLAALIAERMPRSVNP